MDYKNYLEEIRELLWSTWNTKEVSDINSVVYQTFLQIINSFFSSAYFGNHRKLSFRVHRKYRLNLKCGLPPPAAPMWLRSSTCWKTLIFPPWRSTAWSISTCSLKCSSSATPTAPGIWATPTLSKCLWKACCLKLFVLTAL